MPVPAQFVDQNPWWKDLNALTLDKHLTDFANSRVKWEPRIKFYFKGSADAIYTIRGPRQIGKTTLIKILIRDSFNNLYKTADSIFYYSCDLVGDPRQLKDIVSTYLDSVRLTSPKKRLLVFLDEVSSVRDWQKAIKYLADNGKLSNCTLILTGSHSIDVRNATENLAGRRGSTSDLLDKVFLPMKFAEFIECRNDALKAKMLSSKIRFQAKRQACLNNLFEGNIDDELAEFALYGKELELLFNDYLLTGGVPKIIDEYVKTSRVSENSYKIYVDAVLGDMMRWDKKETFVRQLICRLSETLGSTVSWNALKNNTDIEGHATVADYVDTLKSGFVLTVIYHLNLSRGSPDYTKNKKIYFLDPFFLHALTAWATGAQPFQSCLELLGDLESTSRVVEGICADHLIRCAFALAKQKQFFDYANSLFYWKSDKQREVDFVLKLREQEYAPIELKYKSEISREDKQSIFDFQKTGSSTKAGVIITKNEMKASEKLVTIPIWLFLLLV